MKRSLLLLTIISGLSLLSLFQNCSRMGQLQTSNTDINSTNGNSDSSNGSKDLVSFTDSLVDKIDLSTVCDRTITSSSGITTCEKINEQNRPVIDNALAVLNHQGSDGKYLVVVHKDGQVMLISKSNLSVIVYNLTKDQLVLLQEVVSKIGDLVSAMSTEMACIYEDSSGNADLVQEKTKIILNKKGTAKVIYLKDCNVHGFIYQPNTEDFNKKLQAVINLILSFGPKVIVNLPPVEPKECVSSKRPTPICQENQVLICTSQVDANKCISENCFCRDKEPRICPLYSSNMIALPECKAGYEPVLKQDKDNNGCPMPIYECKAIQDPIKCMYPMTAIRACQPNEKPELMIFNKGTTCEIAIPSCDGATIDQ